MTFEFRPAVRENVGLLIGLSGGTGSGKTFSAMRLAAGIAGDKPFAVIDTEAGRARHYADRFKFDHGDLGPPFRPEKYADAIKAADDAGYPVIVVDSASHCHAGEGGLMDWHEEELQRMAGDDWKRREACKMSAWIKPKTAHKAFVNRLLQVRTHLILCFRAEEKVEMKRNDQGKMEIVPKQTRSGRDGWVPICEKNLPFEMTCSFLLLSDRPGYPNPIKLEEQHRSIFPLDHPIDEASGRAIAEWAGGANPTARASTGPSLDNEEMRLREQGGIAAKDGMKSLQIWFHDLSKNERAKIKQYLDTTLKPIALNTSRQEADNNEYIAPVITDVMTAEDAAEFLAMKIEAMATVHDTDELAGMDMGVKKALAGHDEAIGEWNAARLRREIDIKKNAA